MNHRIPVNIITIIRDKSFLNAVVFLVVFPIFLYLVKTTFSLMSWGVTGFSIIFLGYLGWTYRTRWHQYQLPVNFIIASALFMKVIAGNTIPLWIVVAVLGIIVFLVQEGISYQEYRSSEVMRQVMLSGVIFSTFLIYSYIFGSIFINNLGPLWLALVCFSTTVNIASFAFYIYRTRHRWILSILVGLLATEIFIGLRVMPYGHLTLSSLLMVFVFFSIIMCKNMYLKKLTLQNIVIQIGLFIVIVGIIITTAEISVV